MQDLFLPHKTKKAMVLEFIRKKKWCLSHEVIAYGLAIKFNRADRAARELSSAGLIKRMDEDRAKFYFPAHREEVWEAV